MDQVVRAARREYRKIDKLALEAEFASSAAVAT
jgi:hypothetical protein